LIESGVSLRQQLLTAAGATLLLSVSARVLILLTSILLARWLGAAAYGAFATAAAALAVLAIFSSLGFPVLVARLLAAYRERGDWQFMRGLISHSSLVVVVVSSLVAALVALIAWKFGDHMTATQLETIWWAMATLPLVCLMEVHAGSLRGLHRPLVSQFSQNLVLPWFFLAALIAWRFGAVDASLALTPVTAFSLRFLSTLAAALAGLWGLLYCLPGQLKTVRPQFDRKHWYRSARPLVFVGLAAVIMTQTDILMLSALRGSEAAGVYQAAARGAELVAFSLLIIATVTQATIARLYSIGDLARLQRLVTVAARSALALSLPVAVVLIVFAEPLLGLVFGSDFERGAGCLVILCVAQLFNVAVGMVGLILNMTGHERDAALGLAFGALTNISANAVLIPAWDIYGAAAATGLSVIVWNILLIIAVRKRTGLRSTVFG
jgi:O-antigen/teichoic acid export membrane protein